MYRGLVRDTVLGALDGADTIYFLQVMARGLAQGEDTSRRPAEGFEIRSPQTPQRVQEKAGSHTSAPYSDLRTLSSFLLLEQKKIRAKKADLLGLANLDNRTQPFHLR